jgi:serine/threonine-protein kinase
MLPEKTPRSLENGEAARAFLQARLALFWKVICLIMVFASALGAVGALIHPGPDLVLDLALAAAAGVLWWLSGTGERSVRFCRTLEVVGLLTFFTTSSFLGRFVLVGFARERSLATADGALMADAYLSILGLVGTALMILVRAALIPSSPRRTLLYTAMVGIPTIVTPTFVALGAGGEFVSRSLDSAAFPWMPAALAMVWCIVVVTSTVISRVIYGLRLEVREAKKLGQYVIEEKIGEGGMGEVYRARHGMLRRPTALKLLRSGHAREGDLVRFEREVQLTARLTHPNTITIFDYGRTDDGIFYYAMELLDGANLQRIVEVSGPQPEGRVIRILTAACAALAEAHSIGLIHRDIKPANIMLCVQGGESDVVKVLDFGLVKELHVDEGQGLTVASTLIGTPHYMAPESISDPASVDARADIYALGAVAYFLLAGSEVFSGKTLVDICSRHLHQAPERLAERGVTVSAELETIVLACLAKKPDERPESAAALRKRLESCGVAPWDGARAEAWWGAHRRLLAGDALGSIGRSRTVEIDARSRALPAQGDDDGARH